MIRPAAVALMLTVSIGGWLAACGSGGTGTPKSDAPKTNFEAKLSRVEESLRIHWSITNTDDQPILVFNRIRPGDGVFDPDAGNGAYVTGRSDGTVEIAMRAFPVPPGTEGVVPYEFITTRLAPGASTGGDLIVLQPFRYRPAAPVEGGGDPLPDNPEQAVFCLGIMAADGDLSSRSGDPEHPVLPHNQQIVDAQTLLCSDPVPLSG
ncbi:MAG: hypothetical protein ACRDTT_20290 [Pseudonocardiaceae bacterium]